MVPMSRKYGLTVTTRSTFATIHSTFSSSHMGELPRPGGYEIARADAFLHTWASYVGYVKNRQRVLFHSHPGQMGEHEHPNRHIVARPQVQFHYGQPVNHSGYIYPVFSLRQIHQFWLYMNVLSKQMTIFTYLLEFCLCISSLFSKSGIILIFYYSVVYVFYYYYSVVYVVFEIVLLPD